MVFEYTNALGCILVPIKPLREQKEDIISSAGLYINTLNQELGRQVVGVDDEAAALLEQYDYPYNRTQFKRILKEAVIRTEGPPPDPYPVSFHLDTSQSLDGMNRDIVRYVLKTCGGNQTSAAKKLGISRTTLWRYLNR